MPIIWVANNRSDSLFLIVVKSIVNKYAPLPNHPPCCAAKQERKNQCQW